LAVLSLTDGWVYKLLGRSWGEAKVTNFYMNGDDARIVYDGDMNFLEMARKIR
jgi:hypothetical protein